MKFGNFILPESVTLATDYDVIDETLKEARLCDELGYDALWMAEQHFDGSAIYVDPLVFAAAVAVQTTRITIGFSVVTMSLHHPVRVAEQVALLDNLSRGRIVLGIGRGPNGQFFQYRGYGVPVEEAQERLLEAEEVLFRIWTAEDYKHEGKYWRMELPVLRPQPYQKPHPPIVRSCSSVESTMEMARQGRPFLMTYHSNEVTQQRLDLYRQTMTEAGYDAESVARNVENCWVMRNVVVAETDAEAEAIGVPALQARLERARNNRLRFDGTDPTAQAAASRAAGRGVQGASLIYGSPATVSEEIAELQRIGVRALNLHFRVGAMSWEDTANSIKLFAQKVAPEFQVPVAG